MLIHRQAAHGMHGRGDHRNKGRSNNQDADGWRKKSVVEDSSASSGAQLEASNVLVGDHQIPVQILNLYVMQTQKIYGVPPMYLR